MTRVPLTHPRLDGRVIHVDPSAVPHHEAAGWQHATTNEPPAPRDEDNNEAGGTPADTEQDASE